MKELSLEKMQRVEGGRDVSASCAWSLAGWFVLAAGATVLTGGASLAIWAAGAVVTSGSTITSC